MSNTRVRRETSLLMNKPLGSKRTCFCQGFVRFLLAFSMPDASELITYFILAIVFTAMIFVANLADYYSNQGR